MLRKALFLLMVMLTVPTIASAMNYWSISATTSPSSLYSAITRPTGDFSTATGSTTTNCTTSGVTQADFTVAPTSGVYTLSYVLIDGVKTPPVSGTTYRVFKGSKINHSLSAVYATQKYTISTSRTGNGLIDPSVQVVAGTTKEIRVVAGLGYTIASVTKADGSAIDDSYAPYTGDNQSRVYTFANVTANKSIKANFTVVPVVDARITTAAQTIAVNAPLVIDGSASTSSVGDGTTTNSWSVSPAGASVTATGATTTFTATEVGDYTVTLNASAGGASDSATVVITVDTAAALQSAVCTACHNDFSPDVIAAWNAGLHGTNSATCQSCHQNGGHVSSHAVSAGGNGGYTQLIAQNAAGRDIAAGSNACLVCHFDVADWSNTPHTQKAQLGKEAVLGYDADPANYTRAAAWINANRYTYLHPGNKNADGTVKDASKLGVRAVMTEKPTVTYSEQTFGVEDIAVVIGSNYKQAYAAWMPGYGYKVLNIRYNGIGGTESMGERTDERVWEGSCIGCHLTGYDPTDLQAEYKDTVVPYDLNPYIADMRVGCEACHGPIADGTVNPSNMSQDQQIDICGRCHGNWNPTVPGTTARKDVHLFKAGDSLVEWLSPENNNGVDRLMRPVWGSVDIKAFKKNGAASDDHEQWYDFKIGKHYGKSINSLPVTCTSCHDPHDNIPGRKYGRRILKGEYDYTAGTSTVCASCHPEASFVDANGKTITKKGVTGALNPHTGKPYGEGVDVVPTAPTAKWPWEEQ